MAAPMVVTRPRGSEEGEALYRVVIAVSAASGGMIAVFAVALGGLPLIAVPTVVLLAAVVRGAPTIAAWAGVALWTLVVPMAHSLGVLAPMAMVVVCLAFAVGPTAFLDWIGADWSGRPPSGGRREQGWIEEGPSSR